MIFHRNPAHHGRIELSKAFTTTYVAQAMKDEKTTRGAKN
jgi:hypothetical protein